MLSRRSPARELECILLERVDGANVTLGRRGGRGASPPSRTRARWSRITNPRRTSDERSMSRTRKPPERDPSLGAIHLSSAIRPRLSVRPAPPGQPQQIVRRARLPSSAEGLSPRRSSSPRTSWSTGAPAPSSPTWHRAYHGGRNASPTARLHTLHREQFSSFVGTIGAAADQPRARVLLFQALHGYLPFVGNAGAGAPREEAGARAARASGEPVFARPRSPPRAIPGRAPWPEHVRRITPGKKRATPGSDRDRRGMSQSAAPSVGRRGAPPAAQRRGGPSRCSWARQTSQDLSSIALRRGRGAGRCRDRAALRQRVDPVGAIARTVIDELVATDAIGYRRDAIEALAALPLPPRAGPERDADAPDRALEQVRRAAGARRGAAPVRANALVVDDLQWADADSLGFPYAALAQDPRSRSSSRCAGPDASSQRLIGRLGAAGRRIEDRARPASRRRGARACAKSPTSTRALGSTRGVPFLIETLAWSAGRAPAGSHTAPRSAPRSRSRPAARRVLDLLAVNGRRLDTAASSTFSRAAPVAPRSTRSWRSACAASIARSAPASSVSTSTTTSSASICSSGSAPTSAGRRTPRSQTRCSRRRCPTTTSRDICSASADQRVCVYVEAAASEAELVLAFDRAAGQSAHLLALTDRRRGLRKMARGGAIAGPRIPSPRQRSERAASLGYAETAIDAWRRAAERWLTAGELERARDPPRASTAGKPGWLSRRPPRRPRLHRRPPSPAAPAGPPVREGRASRPPPRRAIADSRLDDRGCPSSTQFRGAVHVLGLAGARHRRRRAAQGALVAEATYSRPLRRLVTPSYRSPLAQVDARHGARRPSLRDRDGYARRHRAPARQSPRRRRARAVALEAPSPPRRRWAGSSASVRHFYMYARSTIRQLPRAHAARRGGSTATRAFDGTGIA